MNSPETGASLRARLAILDARAIDTPNLFHPDPVLVMRIELGEARLWRSDQTPHVVKQLLLALPGLAAQESGRGFAQRLEHGAPVGDLIAAVTLALSRSAGIESPWGTSLDSADPDVSLVVVQYRDEGGMRVLLEGAVALVDALLDGRPNSVHETVAAARRVVARSAPAVGMQAIIDAAAERNIPWRRIDARIGLMRLGWGRHSRWIDSQHCGSTGLIAAHTAADRGLVAQLLREACIPAPNGHLVHSADAAMQALQDLTSPLVLKPASGPHRRHVTLRVTTAAEAAAAYAHAALVDRRVLVEEQARGRDYRVLVVDGKLVAASERIAAQVVGDGSATIARLIERENTKRSANHGQFEQPVAPIRIDAAVEAGLAGRGLWLDSVPAASARVPLRETASLASGGTAIDVTAAVHADVAAMCVRAAQVIGLDVCGIDVISPDIARAVDASIVDVQAAPSLEMHCRPNVGEPRQVGKAIIEMLYPARGGSDRCDGRIPLVALLGRDDCAVTQLIAKVLAAGKTVGLACTDGLWIGGRKVAQGSALGAARAVLANPAVDIAVLELAHDAVVLDGLGYDWSDIAVLHAPSAGGDMQAVAELVAARVRRGGTLVVNADAVPTSTVSRVQRAGRRLLCYAEDARADCLGAHLGSGGCAIAGRDGWIVALAGDQPIEPLIAFDALPATCTETTAALHAALAAVAVARALDLDPEVLRRVLMSATS